MPKVVSIGKPRSEFEQSSRSDLGDEFCTSHRSNQCISECAIPGYSRTSDVPSEEIS